MLTNHSDSIASAATSAVRCGFIAETFHCMTQTDAAPPMVPSDDLAALIIRANETSAAFDAAYERLDAAKDAVDARVPRPEILGLDQDGPDTLTRLQRDGDRLATDFIVALFPLDAAGRAASEADFKRKFAELRASLSEVKAYIEGVTEARRELGITELDARLQATIRDLNAAEAAVLAFPAVSVADCVEKLRFGVRTSVYEESALDAVNHVITDLSRIAGGRA